jgi:hypothetical protein
MTVTGVTPPEVRGPRHRGRSRSAPSPVVVARVTLPRPLDPPTDAGAAEVPAQSRRDLHAARRLRRRDALLGLGVLAVAFGGTVTVLDVFH